MSDSDDESWLIHYSIAFTWPIEELGGGGDAESVTSEKKQKTGMTPAFPYSSKCRPWSDPKQVGARNNPRWYFQCLIAFLNTHKTHMLGDVKFTVWMHGKLGEAHGAQLSALLVRAAAPARVAIEYCPIDYPWQFPMSARMIPLIDAKKETELVIVLDVHDNLQRQKEQVGYFLNVVIGETDLPHNGILTYWPVEPGEDHKEGRQVVKGSGVESFAALRSKGGANDYKTVNAVPVARATARKGGVVYESLPHVKKGLVEWWYVDAGLVITNNTARSGLRAVYKGITFEQHLDRIVAKTNYAADWWSAYNKAATDEMALSQYLLAFQPQRTDDGFLGQWFEKEYNLEVVAMWKTVTSQFGPYVHALGQRTVEPEQESGGVTAPDTLEPIEYNEWKLLNDTRKLKIENRFLITGEHAKTAQAAQSFNFQVAIKAKLEFAQAIPKTESRQSAAQSVLTPYTSALVGS
jgi:hypothetical protein